MKVLERNDVLDLTTAGTVTGLAIHVEQMEGYSICATWTGTAPTGTFKLQASNDAFTNNVNNNENPTATWVDITGSSTAITASGTYFWNVSDVYYKAVRLVYVRTSGTGSGSAFIYAKGIQ